MSIRDRSNIDALKARLKAYAETHVTRQQLIPQLHIDCMVEKEWLTIENIEGLSMLCLLYTSRCV